MLLVLRLLWFLCIYISLRFVVALLDWMLLRVRFCSSCWRMGAYWSCLHCDRGELLWVITVIDVSGGISKMSVSISVATTMLSPVWCVRMLYRCLLILPYRVWCQPLALDWLHYWELKLFLFALASIDIYFDIKGKAVHYCSWVNFCRYFEWPLWRVKSSYASCFDLVRYYHVLRFLMYLRIYVITFCWLLLAVTWRIIILCFRFFSSASIELGLVSFASVVDVWSCSSFYLLSLYAFMCFLVGTLILLLHVSLVLAAPSTSLI